MSTAQAILSALSGYDLKQEGQGRYRCNSPLRPGSNSHAFTLTIEGDEHGAWKDHVSDESGSLYELARRLNIETGRASVASTKRAYQGIDDYAAAHGIDRRALMLAGWRECTYKNRTALEFRTDGGTRWRFLDDQKPTYISQKGYRACWYGLTQPIAESVDDEFPLIICNGEISVVSAQAHNIAAICVTSGEKGRVPDELIRELKQLLKGNSIVVALDCDDTGRRAAAGMVDQLRAAGFNARAIDLKLSDGGDLADFCLLHGPDAPSRLFDCPPLSMPREPLPTTQRDYGLPQDKLIGAGRSWIMLHSDNLRFLPQVTWVLKPYIPSHGLVVIYGPSGTGKSFLALWFALQIAQQKAVLYMAYEGEYGYQARIKAAQNFYHFGRGLTLTLGQVDLMSDDDFSTFIESARKVNPSVVFVDTLARSMGELDENSTRDMNIYVTRCNRLMAELKCSVILVHHTNKGGAVERGSVALRGAADVMIRLEDSDERVLVECAKTKDGKPFQSFHIRLHSIDTMLVDDENNPVFTPVAVLAHDDDMPDSLLTKHQSAILSQMALGIYSDDGVTFSQIKEAVPQIPTGTFNNVLSSLKAKGYIQQPERRGPWHITEAGREALSGGKPWQPPTEDEALPSSSSKPAKQARLLPGASKYHEAGL